MSESGEQVSLHCGAQMAACLLPLWRHCARQPCLKQGSPNPSPQTGIGLWPVRNQAARQEMGGKRVSRASSVFTAPPHHLHPHVLGKIVSRDTRTCYQRLGTAGLNPYHPHIIYIRLSFIEVEATCQRSLDGKWLRNEVPTERALGEEEAGRRAAAWVPGGFCAPCGLARPCSRSLSRPQLPERLGRWMG